MIKNDEEYSIADKNMAIAITKDDAIKFGESMATALQYKFSFENLFSIITNILKGTISYDDSLNISNFQHSGSLIIKGENNFDIFLDPLATYMRNNFTLAHELGHYYLHYMLQDEKINNIKFYRRDSNLLEWQANWFAAGFLMPSKKLEKLQNKYGDNIDIIATELDVSIEALKYRIDDLKK